MGVATFITKGIVVTCSEPLTAVDQLLGVGDNGSVCVVWYSLNDPERAFNNLIRLERRERAQELVRADLVLVIWCSKWRGEAHLGELIS